MCRQVTCKTCGKPTWTGCGAHIEQALANVPKAERCKCSEQASASSGDQQPKKKPFGLF